MEKESNPNLIVKANNLVNSRYELSLTECRIIEMAIAQIEQDDTELREYEINLRELMQYTQTYSENFFKLIKEAGRRLVGRTLDIPKPEHGKDGFVIIPLVNRVEYVGNAGILKISFDRDLKPFLLQLKENFTQYERMYILQLGSIYATRLYQYLKQMPFLPTKEYEVEELKKRLCLEEKYKNYNDFKKFVVLVAQREINTKTDITFEFEEIKQQKRVASLRFHIEMQQNTKALQIPPLPSHLPSRAETFEFRREEEQPLHVDVVTLFFDLGIGATETEIRSFVTKFGETSVLDALCYTKEQHQNGVVKTPFSYLYKAIEGQYGKGMYQKQQTEKLKKATADAQNKQAKEDHVQLEQLFKSTDFANHKRAYFQHHFTRLTSEQLIQERADFAKFIKTFPRFKTEYYTEQDQLIPEKFIYWVGAKSFRDEQLFIEWVAQTQKWQVAKKNEKWVKLEVLH